MSLKETAQVIQASPETFFSVAGNLTYGFTHLKEDRKKRETKTHVL